MALYFNWPIFGKSAKNHPFSNSVLLNSFQNSRLHVHTPALGKWFANFAQLRFFATLFFKNGPNEYVDGILSEQNIFLNYALLIMVPNYRRSLFTGCQGIECQITDVHTSDALIIFFNFNFFFWSGSNNWIYSEMFSNFKECYYTNMRAFDKEIYHKWNIFCMNCTSQKERKRLYSIYNVYIVCSGNLTWSFIIFI